MKKKEYEYRNNSNLTRITLFNKSGAIRLQIESMQVEVHTEITNMGNQDDEFHKGEENK